MVDRLGGPPRPKAPLPENAGETSGATSHVDQAGPIERSAHPPRPPPTDGLEAARPPPPPAPGVRYEQKAFGQGSPLMARFRKELPPSGKRTPPEPLPTIHEDLATDDPRHALRSMGAAPPADENERHLPEPPSGLSQIMEIARGTGLAAAAGTKLAKGSSAAVYVAGEAAAKLAGAMAGAAGHGVMAAADAVSAYQSYKRVNDLKTLRSAVVEAKHRAAEAARTGDTKAGERAERMGRAEKIFDDLIHEAHHGQNGHLFDALVNASASAGSALLVAGSAVASVSNPVSLGILALREGQHAVHELKEAQAVRERKASLEPAVDQALAHLNGLIDQYNQKQAKTNLPEVRPMTREHLPDEVGAFLKKEQSRLKYRAQRLQARGIADGVVAAGAVVAAGSTIGGAAPGVAAGYGVMAAGASTKGVTALVRALQKTKRHERRDKIYNDLKTMLRQGTPEDRLAVAQIIERYTEGKIHASDVLAEPEQAIDFLKALEKVPLKDHGASHAGPSKHGK